jgi:hypothetical protein
MVPLEKHSVNQPLKHLIQKQFVEKVNAVAEGREPFDSIRSTFERKFYYALLECNFNLVHYL